MPSVKLALMQRPAAGADLLREISSLGEQGVDHVVSLLEASEAAELGLSHEGTVCAQRGISFLTFPIPDRGIPTDATAFSVFVEGLAELLRGGKSVVIHCRAGIGRSGLVVACVLIRLGVAPEEVFAIVSAARGLRVPDTNEQAAWVHAFALRNPSAA